MTAKKTAKKSAKITALPFSGDRNVHWVACAPNQEHIAVAVVNPVEDMWEVLLLDRGGRCVATWGPTEHELRKVLWADGGAVLLVEKENGLLGLGCGSLKPRFEIDHPYLYDFSVSPSGDRVAMAGSDGEVFVHRAGNGSEVWSSVAASEEDQHAVVFSPDDDELLTADGAEAIRAWSASGEDLGVVCEVPYSESWLLLWPETDVAIVVAEEEIIAVDRTSGATSALGNTRYGVNSAFMTSDQSKIVMTVNGQGLVARDRAGKVVGRCKDRDNDSHNFADVFDDGVVVLGWGGGLNLVTGFLEGTSPRAGGGSNRAGGGPIDFDACGAAVRVIEIARTPERGCLHDRLELKLELQLEGGDWRQLLWAYTHDSYDGEDRVVVEDSHLDQALCGELLQRLDTNDYEEVLAALVGGTDHAEELSAGLVELYPLDNL